MICLFFWIAFSNCVYAESVKGSWQLTPSSRIPDNITHQEVKPMKHNAFKHDGSFSLQVGVSV
jgi:hypothetical protein